MDLDANQSLPFPVGCLVALRSQLPSIVRLGFSTLKSIVLPLLSVVLSFWKSAIVACLAKSFDHAADVLDTIPHVRKENGARSSGDSVKYVSATASLTKGYGSVSAQSHAGW